MPIAQVNRVLYFITGKPDEATDDWVRQDGLLNQVHFSLYELAFVFAIAHPN